MVYADVPEHEGILKGEAPEVAPRPVSTDGWLERISDQLQVFVDAINAAREDDEEDPDGDDGEGDGATSTVTVTEPDKGDADKSVVTEPAKDTDAKPGPTGPDTSTPAKKTTAAKRP